MKSDQPAFCMVSSPQLLVACSPQGELVLPDDVLTGNWKPGVSVTRAALTRMPDVKALISIGVAVLPTSAELMNTKNPLQEQSPTCCILM